jgi:hypothetical protein
MFDNRTYTDAEIDYNIALCELVIGNKQAAKTMLARYESFTMLF